jgi:hypothetical protein
MPQIGENWTDIQANLSFAIDAFVASTFSNSSITTTTTDCIMIAFKQHNCRHQVRCANPAALGK